MKISAISTPAVHKHQASKSNPIVDIKTSKPQRPDSNYKYSLAPYKNYNLSFGAMKKAEFESFDLAAVNIFKAPISSFNTKDDLKTWAQGSLNTLLDAKQYEATKGVTKERGEDLSMQGINTVNTQRMPLVEAWKNYLTKENDVYKNDPVQALLIFSSIIKEVKKENTTLPLALNPRGVADTMGRIKNRLQDDKNYQFNFAKEYQNTLKALAWESADQDTGATYSGWVKIPSEKNDAKNFAKNVEKLQALSHNSWCTKSYNAEPYLKEGDFHIYLENGKPKAGVRFEGDEVVEIQGPKNNGKVPLDYFDVVKEHITNDIKDTGEGVRLIDEAQKRKVKLDKVKQQMQEQNISSPKDIFEFFGIKTQERTDKKLIISHYKELSRDFSSDELGIKEEKLLSNVVEIEGDADFTYSDVERLNSLERIGGNAFFKGYNFEEGLNCSRVRELNSLNYIGKNADFEYSQVKKLNSLKEVGGNLSIGNSKIEEMNSLERIGGSISTRCDDDYDYSTSNICIKKLSSLKYIGGDAEFSYSDIENLGSLEEIGGSAEFYDVENVNLGSLKRVGKRSELPLNATYKKFESFKEICSVMGIKDEQGLRSDWTSIEEASGFITEQMTNSGIDQAKDAKNIFKFFGIQVKERDSGGLVISHYKQPNIARFSQLGINEQELLCKVVAINKDADFRDCEAESLPNLQLIKGNADFSESNIKRANRLKYILGDASFDKPVSLKSITEIRGNLNTPDIDFDNYIYDKMNRSPLD